MFELYQETISILIDEAGRYQKQETQLLCLIRLCLVSYKRDIDNKANPG